MNAKKIKNILISYIKATAGEVRIYQEKSIGNSICDVMAVTDRLIGYEIKSDLDNYTRLQEQVKLFGFSVILPTSQDVKKPYLHLEKDTNRYVVLLGDSANGNAKRIVGKLKRFDKVVEEIVKEIEVTKQAIHNNQQLLKQKNASYQKQIADLSDEIEEIRREIDVVA